MTVGFLLSVHMYPIQFLHLQPKEHHGKGGDESKSQKLIILLEYFILDDRNVPRVCVDKIRIQSHMQGGAAALY